LEVASTFTRIEQHPQQNPLEENIKTFKEKQQQILNELETLKQKIIRVANLLEDVKLNLKEGPLIYWHQRIKDVPLGMSILFDTLFEKVSVCLVCMCNVRLVCV
jgi:hypothetical protein